MIPIPIVYDSSLVVMCRLCGTQQILQFNKRDYNSWKMGALIQKAMPYMTADQRELLISGTCGKCWRKMFGGGDQMTAEGGTA